MARSTFVYVSYIRTTPEKLWFALTDMEFMKQLLVRHALRKPVDGGIAVEDGALQWQRPATLVRLSSRNRRDCW